MASFTDDFERADGPLGNGWLVTAGSVTISSGNCVANAVSAAYNPAFNDPGDAEVTTVVNYSGADISGLELGLGANQANGAYHFCGFDISALGVGAYIKYYNGQSVTQLTSGTVSFVPGATVTLTFRKSGTTFYAYANGSLACSVVNVQADSGGYFGLVWRNTYASIASMGAASYIPTDITVTPDPLWVGAGVQPIHIVGTETSWTPGTPGSSIVSADHGTVTMQTCIDATHIDAYYEPAEYIGPIVFTESEYGSQDTVNAVAVQPEGYGGIGQLSQAAIDYIERSAVAQISPTILNQDFNPWDLYPPYHMWNLFTRLWKAVSGSATEDEPSYPSTSDLSAIYARLWGGEEWLSMSFAPPGTNSVKAAIDGTMDAPLPLKTADVQQLETVVSLLASGPGYSLEGLEYSIGVLGQAEYASVIDAFVQLRGPDNPTLTNIADLIQQLATIAGYDLSSVKGWIDDMRGDAPNTIHAVWELLNDLNTFANSELADIHNDLFTVDGIVDHLLTDEHALTGNGANSLQTILTAIGNIPSGDLTPVLTAIANLRGDEVSTVKAIQDIITEIHTADHITLKTVLDKIGGNPDDENWTPLLAILLLLAAIAGGASAVTDLITKVRSGTLDTIIDLIDLALQVADLFRGLWDAFTPSSPTYSPIVPPIYPGIDKVQLLDPVPFDTATTIEVACHGALIDVSTVGEHPYAIRSGTITRYGRLGCFAFRTDGGDNEPIQPIQWLKQVATPKAIARPGGLVVQCKPGTIGTVTPYLLI